MSRYDGSADERQTPFDEQLAALLARTANSAQPSPNLAQRVRQALTASAAPTHHAPRRFALGFPSLGRLVGPAMVATLLTVFVLVFAAHGWEGFRPGAATTPLPNCPSTDLLPTKPSLPANPPDHSVALGQSVTHHNITITLLRGYADAVSTIVTYAVTPSAIANAQASQTMLTDATGAHYLALTQTQGNPFGIMFFPPLPQSHLGSPQRLTVSIGSLDVPVPTDGTPTVSQVQGTWVIPFTITPVAGMAIPLTLPAQTHNGVTVTLEELDVAPAGGGMDGIAGGVRARFKISGLDPTAKLDTALEYPSLFVGANGDQGLTPGGPACHNTLTLTLANGQKLIPGFITLAGVDAPEASMTGMGWDDTLTVGASGVMGVVEAQALFYTPAKPGKVTFAINTVSISEVRNFKSVFVRNAQGPWTFTVPLQK